MRFTIYQESRPSANDATTRPHRPLLFARRPADAGRRRHGRPPARRGGGADRGAVHRRAASRRRRAAAARPQLFLARAIERAHHAIPTMRSTASSLRRRAPPWSPAIQARAAYLGARRRFTVSTCCVAALVTRTRDHSHPADDRPRRDQARRPTSTPGATASIPASAATTTRRWSILRAPAARRRPSRSARTACGPDRRRRPGGEPHRWRCSARRCRG